MKTDTIEVVYEGGVFKPLEKVKLKEHTRGRVIVSSESEDVQSLVKAQTSALKKIVGIGSSGSKDTARKHNEYIYERPKHDQWNSSS